MKKNIQVPFNEDQARTLIKILLQYNQAILVNNLTSKMDFRIGIIKECADIIDEGIHLQTKWCDNPDCSYWKHHPKKKEKHDKQSRN